MKQIKTMVLLQTLRLQFYKNYPQLIFYRCFLQDNGTLKVA